MKAPWKEDPKRRGKRGCNPPLFLPLCLAILLLGVPAWAITGPEILQKVESRYATLNDLSADFTWRVRSDPGEGKGGTGRLYLKRPHLFRLELADGHLLVCDGQRMCRYYPAGDRVTVDSLSRPLWWEELLSRPSHSFRPQLVGEESLGGKGCYLVELTPRGEGSWTGRLRIWVDRDRWLIRQVEVLGWEGEVTTYRFTRIRLNRGLADSLFVLKASGG